MVKKSTTAIIALIIIASLVLFSKSGETVILTEETLDPDFTYTNTEAAYKQMINVLSPTQERQFLLGGRSLKLGGATCSENWDKNGDYTPSHPDVTKKCVQNTNHIGMTFELWETTKGIWEYKGRVEILQGEKGCHNVEFGKTYYWEYYYCDGLSTIKCIDSDGGISSKVPGTVTTSTGSSFSDVCSGDTLLERFCDADNTVDTRRIQCTDSCENGACQKDVAQEETLTVCYAGHVYTSTNTGNLITRKEYCRFGCKNAACITEPEELPPFTGPDITKSCAETDGGVNRFEKGTVIFTREIEDLSESWKDTDVCVGDFLREMSCPRANDYPTATVIDCKLGCVDGACVERIEETTESIFPHVERFGSAAGAPFYKWKGSNDNAQGAINTMNKFVNIYPDQRDIVRVSSLDIGLVEVVFKIKKNFLFFQYNSHRSYLLAEEEDETFAEDLISDPGLFWSKEYDSFVSICDGKPLDIGKFANVWAEEPTSLKFPFHTARSKVELESKKSLCTFVGTSR